MGVKCSVFLYKCNWNTFSFFLTYLLTPWSRVLLENLTGPAASQEIPRIFGTQRFITSWRSILILSSHLCLGLPNGLFPSGFPTRTLCTPLPSPICGTCPAHLILLDFTTRTIFGKEYRSLSSSLCNFLHSRYLIPLRPKYSPQHPILKHPQPTFLPQWQWPSFSTINILKVISEVSRNVCRLSLLIGH